MRSLVISKCLYVGIVGIDSRVKGKNAYFLDEIQPKVTEHSYKNHITNENVRRQTQAVIGEYDELKTMVQKRKLSSLAMSQGH